MNRRDFINKSLAAAALCCTAGYTPALAGRLSKKKKNRTGIQLYSINRTLPQNISGSLKKLADIGYQYAETYGYNGRESVGKTLKEWAVLLNDTGMKLSGTHCGTPVLPQNINASEWDYWRNSADAMNEAGGGLLVQSFLPSAKSSDEVKRVAEQFNRIGRLCGERGIKFGYHNHYEEFRQMDGKAVLELLLENTDPALVFFQLDLGHAVNGGGDIISYFRKYPKRFRSWHVSDFKKGVGYVEVGKGDVPYDALFDMAAACGLEDLTVEQETDGDIYTSLKHNFDFLAKYKWTRGK
ncbi:MAG: sugar phosphate isomerase/epimerase [Prevotellaceae bacterium]|jgi:sugar phosphate isomerase/epimerase|nr:sugar phosphate isomerase/epimerase [Prevotellaceae bacterium]